MSSTNVQNQKHWEEVTHPAETNKNLPDKKSNNFFPNTLPAAVSIVKPNSTADDENESNDTNTDFIYNQQFLERILLDASIADKKVVLKGKNF